MSINKIYDNFREPLGFLVDLVSLTIYLLGCLNLIIKFVIYFATYPLIFQISAFIIALLLLIVIFIQIKRNLIEIKFRRELNNVLDLKIEKDASERYKYDFEKIIPKQVILESIISKCDNIAKHWSTDAVLSDLSLNIMSFVNGKMEYILNLEYYSFLKKIKIKMQIKNFKFDKKLLENSDFWYDENVTLKKPFFKYKNWRDAVITSFRSIEHSLLNKTFYSFIEQIDMGRVHILPSFGKNEAKKSFVFWFNDQKLIEGTSIYSESKVIKNY